MRPSGSARSAAIPRRSPGTGRRWCAGSSRPVWPHRSSISRGWAPRPTTRTTAWASSTAAADDIETHELVPFRAAIAAGARTVMSSHIAVPGLTGDPTLPATLSRAVFEGTLRGELGFDGITISDALDMHALAQGAAQAVEIIAAIRAGIDLLLTTADRDALDRIESTLVAAAARGLFEADEMAASARRLAELRAWLAGFGPAPDLDVVGSAEHRALSRELAERSLTRLDTAGDGTEPATIALAPTARILAIMPQPADLTPADTSSAVAPGLARALRTRFVSVEEVVVEVAPSDAEIAGLRERADRFDAIVIGTIEAHRQPDQAALVRALAGTGTPTIAVAHADAVGRGRSTRPGFPRSPRTRSCPTRSRRSPGRWRARSASLVGRPWSRRLPNEPRPPDDLCGHSPLYACRPLNQSEPE